MCLDRRRSRNSEVVVVILLWIKVFLRPSLKVTVSLSFCVKKPRRKCLESLNLTVTLSLNSQGGSGVRGGEDDRFVAGGTVGDRCEGMKPRRRLPNEKMELRVWCERSVGGTFLLLPAWNFHMSPVSHL